MTAAAVALVPRAVQRVATGVSRTTLADASDGPLMFAQVREDPLVEMQALTPALDGTIVVVSSGGCTALSLLAAGAQHVVGVDLSGGGSSVRMPIQAFSSGRLRTRAMSCWCSSSL